MTSITQQPSIKHQRSDDSIPIPEDSIQLDPSAISNLPEPFPSAFTFTDLKNDASQNPQISTLNLNKLEDVKKTEPLRCNPFYQSRIVISFITVFLLSLSGWYTAGLVVTVKQRALWCDDQTLDQIREENIKNGVNSGSVDSCRITKIYPVNLQIFPLCIHIDPCTHS